MELFNVKGDGAINIDGGHIRRRPLEVLSVKLLRFRFPIPMLMDLQITIQVTVKVIGKFYIYIRLK